MESAFESTRWARARLSVRTTAVTGVAVGVDFGNEPPSTATPVHGIVRTRDAFWSL